ncbi:hypothetical protein PMZ80_003688 [Knufia obscura]|uniref:Mitochondrial intermembrane space cysteine motif-containing protein MIX17 n=2 Tax=Knufia TaxID=430999 RepID=A0AAN8I960_9EURO|nr:hypothetical protein PMZ80_003688 [Knufia obscura]KAK5958399.1 hypothetical protein OHC33_000242 [Knufia fluminis]
MPRSRGGAAPARSAPNRPQAAPPARSAPNQQQQRPMSTAPAAPPHQAPAAQAPTQSQSPGLFGQMASTAAGVAVGSSIGHAIGGFFGGGSSQAAQAPAADQYAQPAQDNFAQAGGAYNTNASAAQEASGPCANDIKSFTSCMNQNGGDMNICGWYMEQLKACQQAARQY